MKHGQIRPAVNGVADRYIHACARVVFDDSTARLAATYSTDDIFCLFADDDTKNLYVLTALPATFVAIGVGAGLTAVVDDTSPQLGGDLDVNGNSIVSISAGDIIITPDTTGSIILDGLSWPQADGSASQVLKTDGAGNLSWTTITSGIANVVEDTSPELGGNLDIGAFTLTGFTASRALEVDESGNLQVSAVTSDELNYLDGVTSAIQGQLNSKLANIVDDTTPQAGGTFDLNGNDLTDASGGNVNIDSASGKTVDLRVDNTSVLEVSASAITNKQDAVFNECAGFDAEYDNGTKTANFEIDWRNGNKQKVTINDAGPLTVTFSNAPPNVANLLLKVIQGATPGTITWPSMKWPDGTIHTLGTTTDDEDLIAMYYDGSGYYAGGALFATP